MISPSFKKNLRKYGFMALRIVLMLFVLLALGVFFFEDQLLYHPITLPEEKPMGAMFPRGTAKEYWITTSDGVRIDALYAMTGDLKDPARKPYTVLWCHGNGGNITHRAEMAREFLRIGVDLMLFDYRGYGKSGGTPSEEGLYRDAEAVYDFLVKDLGVMPGKVVIFGKSLGGAVAVDLASKKRCAALILQSSFTGAKDVASAMLPVFPVRWFMRSEFDAAGKIGKVMVPTLFIHSPADEVIPYRLGRALYDVAPEPKEFYDVPDAGHNETFIVGGSRYWKTIDDFIDRLRD